MLFAINHLIFMSLNKVSVVQQTPAYPEIGCADRPAYRGMCIALRLQNGARPEPGVKLDTEYGWWSIKIATLITNQTVGVLFFEKP